MKVLVTRFKLTLILTMLIFAVFGQSKTISVPDLLNEEELLIFKKVKEYHKDLELSQSVTRHYTIVDGDSLLMNTTLNFTKGIEGFYFEGYVFYEVSISPDNMTISYTNSVGAALTSTGKINILGAVIRNDFSYGTAAGTVSVWVNDKLIFEETEEF